MGFRVRLGHGGAGDEGDAGGGFRRKVQVWTTDLFNSCPQRGLWSDKPKDLDCCLIFATLSSAVTSTDGQLQMANIPRKHVGIYLKGSAYNYHNTTNEGVAVNGDAFFKNLYGKGTVALYGTFPQ